MMHYLPSESLKSRTFAGLLLAQFTATFNDQAIHIVAIFYASDVFVRYLGLRGIDEKAVVALVTACFITPFLLFSPIAGAFADRFSKRSIIIFWKLAEVVMMLIALVGFSLPHWGPAWGVDMRTVAACSAALVTSVVLLMGLHSTFFVPAKYGAMPEILQTSILSRGNGLLEGTSFMAQIFGTSAGGVLYALFKSRIGPGTFEPGQEWLIGVLLLLLALLGMTTSILMAPIPAAAPERKIGWTWWQPLQANLSIVFRSKPLLFAVIGIAFAAFMTLFLRQTLLYQGEIAERLQVVQRDAGESVASELLHLREPGDGQPVPAIQPATRGVALGVARAKGVIPSAWSRVRDAVQQAELRVALLIALVGLGVGLGSLAAGYLSGHRVELGLIPIGGLSLTILMCLMAYASQTSGGMALCLFLIGISAGFYIVPLYTLMQHCAPKDRKGNVVAASNFLNVAGGILAVGLFYALTFALELVYRPELSEQAVRDNPQLRDALVMQLQRQMSIPRLLYVTTGGLTVVSLVLLIKRLPDLWLRTLIWVQSLGRHRLAVIGLDNLPTEGPVVLVTNCQTSEHLVSLLVTTDRYTQVILPDTPGLPRTLADFVADQSGMLRLPPVANERAWEQVRRRALETLRQHGIVAVPVDVEPAIELQQSLSRWQVVEGACIVPVHGAVRAVIRPDGAEGQVAPEVGGRDGAASRDVLCFTVGTPLAPGASLDDVRVALSNLGREADRLQPLDLLPSA